MQHHHAERKPERIIPEYRACGEEAVILSERKEEERCSEDYTTFDLQCGDSLAVAANRIGEEAFGAKRLLQRNLRRVAGILFPR